MEKVILVDGNNLLFRSYYATAYNGNFMNNSKGFPTNAIFGFANMINKIVLEEKPKYMLVAFDKGKNFRKEKYDFYKDGRSETPSELKMQFPIAKDLLTKMGIKYYEIDDYEADDIIGTFANMCNGNQDYDATIISSDKDLLQLISKEVDIKLLKQKDYIRYNSENFRADYGIEPINIIDLKALMGDASDNIPGVKGIGEKTALKLLQVYKTIDKIYENIDNLKGSVKEKLINGKDSAYMSYEIATIILDVPLDITFDDILLQKKDSLELTKLYEELEFYSFIKKEKKEEVKPLNFNIADKIDFKIDSNTAIYLEILGTNYHTSEILGLAVYNENISTFIPFELLKENKNILNQEYYTYDLKKLYVSLKYHDINIGKITFDTMLAGYLLDYNIKDDIAYLANIFEHDIPFYETTYGKTKLTKPSIDVIAYNAILKAKFIYESKDILNSKLKEEKQEHLFYDIELPLSIVLGDMEFDGVNVDKDYLNKMGIEIKERIDLITNEIYDLVEEEFNISSPQQLGYILFEKLQLKHGKKLKTGYSTSIDVLNKLVNEHPVIKKIIEYRFLTKLYSTYIEGLIAVIHEDNKIHTIYTQALTRTGRLSSIEPNLQNIPMRNEYGKLIRKAFVSSENSVLISSDYSQIELRILAHVANVLNFKEAFNNNIDIHTKTASDIFKKSIEEVTKNERRLAKAVNFGIIYGISGFGLSQNIDIPVKEASDFINNYLLTYPEIKTYMDDTIKNAYNTLSVKTLMGRIRYVKELSNKNYMIKQQGERIALNTPIQGTSADIIKLAMVKIKEKFIEENIKSKLILQVHDELIFDCLINEEEKVKSIIKDIMENVYPLDVVLDVDIEEGKNWFDAK